MYYIHVLLCTLFRLYSILNVLVSHTVSPLFLMYLLCACSWSEMEEISYSFGYFYILSYHDSQLVNVSLDNIKTNIEFVLVSLYEKYEDTMEVR